MMIVILVPWNLGLLCFIVLELLILRWSNEKTGWTKKSNVLTVFAACTAIILCVQVGSVYDLMSYEQGEIGYSMSGVDFPYYSEVEVPPGETQKIGTMSNWNTVLPLVVRILAGQNNVTFYFMDQNVPAVRFQSGNISGSDWFRLPYRYTWPFVIANWTANLQNPSETEPITVSVTIYTLLVEDEWYTINRPMIFWHTLPSYVLLTFWAYAGLSMFLAKPSTSAIRVQAGQQSKESGSPTAQKNPERI